ncbi:hypothetical protein HDR61_01590 [bacterium]|nr:hypothetical protein [bacterium]
MTKKQQITSMPDNPADLIYRLNDFYNKNPDYETSVTNISLLMRMAHQEMDKFVRRPHTQVTKIYFDGDAPTASIIR